MSNRRKVVIDPAKANLATGINLLNRYSLFSEIGYLYSGTSDNLCPANGWAVVTSNGAIHLHPTRRAEPEEWVYAIAHCKLHLAFEHFKVQANPLAWAAACDMVVAKFLADLKLGRLPGADYQPEVVGRSEESLYREYLDRGVPEPVQALSMAGMGIADMVFQPPQPIPLYSMYYSPTKVRSWQTIFADNLSIAVSEVVDWAGGIYVDKKGERHVKTMAQLAQGWFMSSYPLLGALAASFKIIEDPTICNRYQISIAAVDALRREIYMNPQAGLTEEECKFVMAHELLHVGLRHHARCQGRDPFLWNVACDYVINAWLMEMKIGTMPAVGVLYDPTLKAESAESVYDFIVNDLRRIRKLKTFRGIGIGDILANGVPNWWLAGDGVDLDDFYRRCLSQGLDFHRRHSRGLLPGDLVEEIEALTQPPVPWDVELARWFDAHFGPIEMRRTYARPSRRQASVPDIPRPRYVPDLKELEGRTFGVLLDTSGSMSRTLLGKALGAIASYSLTHDVVMVRVVFCDAAPYDAGYMPPEAIAGDVQVRGRGGTTLQPAVDLLETAEDFPDDAPILIITDGMTDHFRVQRQHAILMPEGARLPFTARGEVFRLTEDE